MRTLLLRALVPAVPFATALLLGVPPGWALVWAAAASVAGALVLTRRAWKRAVATEARIFREELEHPDRRALRRLDFYPEHDDSEENR
jgi:hypothetical protein